MWTRMGSLFVVGVTLLIACSSDQTNGAPGSDASLADTTTVDSSTIDGSKADGSVNDSSVADSSVADTSVADTSVADAADTSVGPTCKDNMQNGNETDVDCGGSCPACPSTKKCSKNSDCQSNNCVNLTCK